MPRKKYEEEHDNHERWLVSYADFITLLFAFFVVMYAISSVNEGKYRILASALGAAFGTEAAVSIPQTPSEPQPALAPRRQTSEDRRRMEALRREKEAMTTIARQIQHALAPLVSQGIVRVTQTASGVKVEINASILFAPGDATLTGESGAALKAIAQILKEDTHALRVEGHTDDVPISTAMFPSNWELSSVRASSVVRLFVEHGIGPGRLTAVGHGANFPVGPNDTAEGRLRNRRVEIMILAALPEKVTEVPVGPESAN
jgi:chemotaxis protein MotB